MEKKSTVNTNNHTALIIPAESIEPIRLQRLEAEPGALEDLVGGAVEALIRGDWHVYLNAEAQGGNFPLNLRAAQLMRECGVEEQIVPRGTAVFLGRGKHWDEADVPEHLTTLAEHLFGDALAA